MQITGETEMIPFNKLRKMTAEHMVRSKAASPHVLQAVEADFGRSFRHVKTRRASGRSARIFYLPAVCCPRGVRRSRISRG